MKKLLFTSICMTFIYISVQAQAPLKDTIKTVFENEKMKVTEYISTPGNDVCGIGKHNHPAHLNIALTDMNVRITTADGKTQNFDVQAGSTFWSEADTHVAINKGNKPARLYIIEPKNK